MDLPSPLMRATLIRRYKRFLADIELDGRTVVAHCPNPGSMLGLAAPGQAVWIAPAENPKAKLSHSWVLTEVEAGATPVMVGINAAKANNIAAEAIAAGAIPQLSGYQSVRREVRYGERSRVDFVLDDPDRPAAYVEVKNVHLSRRPGLAEFPDSVTARGARHLAELTAMVEAGARAVMLYVVQRGDNDRFKLAGDIDPAYAAAFGAARAAGVEALCYACTVTPKRILLDRQIPIED